MHLFRLMVKQIANIIPTETNITNSTQLYDTTTIFCKALSIRIRSIYSGLVDGYFTTVVVKLFWDQNKCAESNFLNQTTISGESCNQFVEYYHQRQRHLIYECIGYHMGCTSYDAIYCSRVGEAFTDSPVAPSYYRHLYCTDAKQLFGTCYFSKKTMIHPMYQKILQEILDKLKLLLNLLILLLPLSSLPFHLTC